MGKYNLGKSVIDVSNKIDKNNLYIDSNKMDLLVNDMDLQLENIRVSLSRINNILNIVTKNGYVKGSRKETFKNWSLKAKSQSNNALKLRNMLFKKYNEDLEIYPIKLLDDRISILEEKIKEMR